MSLRRSDRPSERAHTGSGVVSHLGPHDQSGRCSSASVLETTSSYRPHEWRAASLGEQAEFAMRFKGNPRPWHCVTAQPLEECLRLPGAAATGKDWAGVGSDRQHEQGVDRRAKAERQVPAGARCRVEHAAFAGETRAVRVGLGAGETPRCELTGKTNAVRSLTRSPAAVEEAGSSAGSSAGPSPSRPRPSGGLISGCARASGSR